jgi:hypothetical protein
MLPISVFDKTCIRKNPPGKIFVCKSKKGPAGPSCFVIQIRFSLFLGDAGGFGLVFGVKLVDNFGDVVADGVSSFSLRIFKKIYAEIIQM